VAAAGRSGAAFTVVSAGLDFYIRALLSREGHGKIPVIAVEARQKGGSDGGRIRYDYPAGQGRCAGDWAICKCRAVEAAKRCGRTVIFAGDGTRSDACAAAKADVVFARAKLLEHCRAEGIPVRPFEADLYPLAEFLERLPRGRRQS
jgi:2-hydroxy-3-keto-5-methylthiopentenyl-1-phosphate phosphatase